MIDWVTIILVAVIVAPLDFCMNYLSALYIARTWYGIDPFKKESQKKGMYFSIKNYTDKGRLLNDIEQSVDEFFGIADKTSIEIDRDMWKNRFNEIEKKYNKIKDGAHGG